MLSLTMLSLETTPFNFRTNSRGIQVCVENEADLIYYLLWDIESPKKIHLLKIRKVLQSLKKKTPCFETKVSLSLFATSPQPPL
jgi:hypothetical protein